MKIEIMEERIGYKSSFRVSDNSNLIGEFSTSYLKSKDKIKIYNKTNSDCYEIREKGWFIFRYKELYLNNKYVGKFRTGKFYNICDSKYEIFLHNNPKHKHPDIFSITKEDEQVALVSRQEDLIGYEYKTKSSLLGTQKLLICYYADYEPNLINIVDLFILAVYKAVFSYNSLVQGGSHLDSGISQTIINEDHPEHLLWKSKDQ
jgi:hypothetical protein